MTCPECGDLARFVEYRSKNIVSLIGELRLSRGYYHCRHCGHGAFPWDQTLRLTEHRLTPGAQEVVCLAGIQESFGKAAERTLLKLAGLRLSESTVERTTETTGTRLGERLASGATFGPAQTWNWNKDATGQTCAYVSLDATGIMIQGPAGAKAEGRMVTVGMIYNPQPRAADDEAISKPCAGVRYLAGLYTLDELGLQMRRQGGQVGMNAADVWVALTDGGNGLEEFIHVNSRLPGKFESERFDPTHDFAMTEARKSSHSSGYHDGEFVLSFNGWQRRRTLAFSQLDQPASDVARVSTPSGRFWGCRA